MSETRYRTVLESLSDAVLTIDESGQIGSANRLGREEGVVEVLE